MIGNFETVQYEVCLGAKAESHAVSSQETSIHSGNTMFAVFVLSVSQQDKDKVSQHYKIIKE